MIYERYRLFKKIYWSPETMQKVVSGFQVVNLRNDANIFAAHSGINMEKILKG